MGALVAMTIPGLAILLIALAFAEVLWHRLTGQRFLPWVDRDGRPVSATGFEEVTALFQGAKHHEFEQRRTVLMHREDLADGAPPRDDIDLGAGSARLVRREDAQPARTAAAPDQDAPDALRCNPPRS